MVKGDTRAWVIEMDGSNYYNHRLEDVVDSLKADTEDTPGVVPVDIEDRLRGMTEGESMVVGPFTVTCCMVDKMWLDNLPEFGGW